MCWPAAELELWLGKEDRWGVYNLEVSYIGNYFPETADLQQVADQGGEFKHILFQLLPG